MSLPKVDDCLSMTEKETFHKQGSQNQVVILVLVVLQNDQTLRIEEEDFWYSSRRYNYRQS